MLGQLPGTRSAHTLVVEAAYTDVEDLLRGRNGWKLDLGQALEERGSVERTAGATVTAGTLARGFLHVLE